MRIKTIGPLSVLVVAWSLAAGCASIESVRSTVKERIEGMPPKVRMVQGEQRQVYEAVRRAIDKLGYQQTSGGPAQGRLEGLSHIGGGDNFRSSRQRSILIHLQPREEGNIEVQVQLQEIVEDNYSKLANPATETPLRDSAGYDAFFDEMERQLQGLKGK
jgi:hypothetical protein